MHNDTLDKLEVTDRGQIVDFTNDTVLSHFIEMGILPGAQVEVCNIAPLGDPLAIAVDGVVISIRKKDAADIIVTRFN